MIPGVGREKKTDGHELGRSEKEPAVREMSNQTTQIATLAAYYAVLALLAMYGTHRAMMVRLYYRHRRDVPRPVGELPKLPRVTVQLPIYNEVYVVERLIAAVAALDYPRELLEIQVLDDSTDETRDVARRAVEAYRRQGYDIAHRTRSDRHGYKAGALQAGLEGSTGEYLLIFDADFVPRPDLLRELLPHFSDPAVGMVQARWEHLNRDYSLLTRIQSIFLDGHFVIEHTARHRSGRFFNFNGTAGIWRRRCLEEIGGWQSDTLTEDLDVSYRAQLAGWRFVYLKDVAAPAELPADMNGFKSQQHRWTKGSIQTGRKLLPAIFRSGYSWKVKVEAFFHLTANISYPLMIVLSFLLLPAMIVRFNQGWFQMLYIDLPLWLASTASVSTFYLISQKELYPDWRLRLKYLPFLMSLGIGLSVSNSKAVMEALLGIKTSFKRTPKFKIESKKDRWATKKYLRRTGVLPILELCLGAYFGLVVFYAFMNQNYPTIPFLMLFVVGFTYMGLMSILHVTIHRWLRGL